MKENRKKIQISLPFVGDEEWLALREPLQSGWLTQGPKVAAFEKKFAELHGVSNALATTSCTTALHLIMAGLGVGEGDEVIVPAFTWVATANAVLYCGATPKFVDINETSFNLCPKSLSRVLTEKTKAIVPVHLFGLCADIDAIKAVAPGLPLIEDAACAVGGRYKGQSAGSLGTAAAFSFHPRKSVTTGEGGMVTTNDSGLAQRIDSLRNHGASLSEEQRHAGPTPYLMADFDVMGFNYRMTDLQGAMGLVQLGRLEQLLAERRRYAEFYRRELSEVAWLRTPEEPKETAHAWQSYVCFVDETRAPMARNAIMQRLNDEGVSTRPGTHAVHMLGFYKRLLGHEPTDFPAAMRADRYSMALPLHNRMTEDDLQYVVDVIKSIG